VPSQRGRPSDAFRAAVGLSGSELGGDLPRIPLAPTLAMGPRRRSGGRRFRQPENATNPAQLLRPQPPQGIDRACPGPTIGESSLRSSAIATILAHRPELARAVTAEDRTAASTILQERNDVRDAPWRPVCQRVRPLWRTTGPAVWSIPLDGLDVAPGTQVARAVAAAALPTHPRPERSSAIRSAFPFASRADSEISGLCAPHSSRRDPDRSSASGIEGADVLKFRSA